VRPSAELDLPIIVDRADGTPLHQQLAAGLRHAIQAGLVPPGGRLPSTRVLAASLGLARNTVLAAYQQLDGEGYLQPKHGSGTYLSLDVPLAAPPPAAAPTDTAPTKAGPTNAAPIRTPSAARTAPAHVALGCAVAQGDTPATACRSLVSGGSASSGICGGQRSGNVPSAGRTIIDLRPGQPDTRRLADPVWHRAWRTAVKDPPPGVEPPPQGLAELRAEICAHLAVARGVSTDPDDIVITSGTSDGLSLLVHAMGLAGRPVAVEDPGYPEARTLLVRHGCVPLPVPVDDDGLIVSALPARHPPSVALVTPSHQYPLGGRLPIARRLSLLDWADRHDVTIVEDDYDSEFRFDVAPLPALAGLDRTGRVVHLGTFSKVLTPWLRLGYLAAPRRLVPGLLGAREDLGVPTSGIDQRALAVYMRQGGLRRHIARARRDYQHTRSHLHKLAARHAIGIRGANAGLHAVLELPEGAGTGHVIGHAHGHGVLLSDLDGYAASVTAGRPSIVFGYGGATLDHLDQAISAIACALYGPLRAGMTPCPAAPAGM
jgi:GntR family transcriptional regulator/MocR family aminotransferase